jgi:hypothetical protein
MKGPTTKAKAIDQTKDKIILAGMALLAGLMALAIFSSSSHANSSLAWNSYSVGEDENRLPFKLKSQILGH